jgi:hypothetical protein
MYFPLYWAIVLRRESLLQTPSIPSPESLPYNHSLKKWTGPPLKGLKEGPETRINYAHDPADPK